MIAKAFRNPLRLLENRLVVKKYLICAVCLFKRDLIDFRTQTPDPNSNPSYRSSMDT